MLIFEPGPEGTYTCEVICCMNRKRLPALLLVLFMCISLLPPPKALAEETGGPVVLRFTSSRPGDTALVTLVDSAGNQILPLSGEDASFLLSPGVYSYYLIDPAGQAEIIPLTPLVLDGSSHVVEIPLRGDAVVPSSAPSDEPQRQDEPQTTDGTAENTQAMPVVLRCREAIDFTGLTVISPQGTVIQPYIDPETGRTEYENYLLLPGQYSFQYHDPRGISPDRQGSFAVTATGMQVVELDFSDGMVEVCYSATAVNPFYADLIRAEYIPAPTISPEESLEQLRAAVEALMTSSVQRSMIAVFQAGPGDAENADGASAVYDNVEAAGAALKRKILQRQTQFSIRVKTRIKPTEDIWWSMCRMIYDEAIRHTGAPAEGDYLRYEYGGINCNGSAAGSVRTGEYYYEFVFSPLYFTTAEQEAELDARVKSILNALPVSGKSDEQKIRAVYQYLCDNVRYEKAENTLGFTAYSALVNGHAACQGFSAAFYRLCLELGVDTRIVTSQEMGHAWNIVRADGKHYYAVDATWDAGKKPEEWKFYLRGRNSWKSEHRIGDEFSDGRFDAYSFPEEDFGADEGPVIHSVSLLFDGLLRIKYYFVLPDSLKNGEGSIQFSRGGEVVSSLPLTQGKEEGAYTCFYCSVNAEDIAAPIQTRILRKDGSFETISSVNGTTYPNGFFFSPMEYARQMKTSGSTPAMRALAQALEDYGTAAQNYFKKESEPLRDEVKAVKAEELDAWAIRTEGAKPQGFNSVSISVMFEADNSLRVYYRFDPGADVSAYSFEIDGKTARLQEKGDGNFFLCVDNIAANELDREHSFTIADSAGRSYTIYAGVLGYAKTAIERGSDAMKDLARAIYLYNRAAEDYFGT